MVDGSNVTFTHSRFKALRGEVLRVELVGSIVAASMRQSKRDCFVWSFCLASNVFLSAEVPDPCATEIFSSPTQPEVLCTFGAS